MLNISVLEPRPARALVVAGALFFALSCAMVLWLVSGLDRVYVEFTESLAEITQIEDVALDVDTVRKLRFGIVVFGATSVLFVSGLIGIYYTFSRRTRRRLSDVFREALEGDTPTETDTQVNTDEIRFDGSVDSARRLGRVIRSQRRGSAVSRARLTRIAELMDVGVLLFDAEFTPVLASTAALRMLGTPDLLPAAETVALLFSTFRNDHDGLPDQAKSEIELEGDLRPVRLRLQLFHLDENCDHGYLILLRDQRVLEALDTDFRMATQLRTLSRLYMGVAHDLKAPLNAIGLNLALLRDSLADAQTNEDKRRKKWVAVVEEELTRLNRDTERLLAQAAPSRKEVATYDLRNVLEGIHDLLLPQGRQQQVRVELSLSPEPALVRGRQDLVKQALLNVAINALEATPEGESVHLDLRLDEDHAFVQICDRGSGIPQEHREHVFEIHFTTKVHGTGIGLYIAQSILEAEGGTLVLKETSSAGTVLESSLPLQ